MKIILVNGPNLNLLGKREPGKYGKINLSTLESELKKSAKEKNCELISFQSNSEGELINFIQSKGEGSDGMILNPGAFTHTSIALRDAILSVNIPFIEIHISNIYKREEFRHISYFKDIAIGQIVGLGTMGYQLGLEALVKILERNR